MHAEEIRSLNRQVRQFDLVAQRSKVEADTAYSKGSQGLQKVQHELSSSNESNVALASEIALVFFSLHMSFAKVIHVTSFPLT
jgi:hypothetical protein